MANSDNVRLARPLVQRAPGPRWPSALVGAAMLLAALSLAASRYGWPRPGGWVAPFIAFVVGTALVWSPLDSASVEDALRPEVVVGLFSREHWARVLVGLGLAVSAMAWFSRWPFTDQPVVRVLVVILVLLVASVLLLGPWLLRLVRQVRVERAERIREFERAEIAAHLHDSVLQTLTLIRKNADDPAAVATLARAQERDLRGYLYQDRRTAEESVAVALATAVSAVEDAHAVAIEVVSVGDAPTDKRLSAAVAAAKEAASNAAKHGQSPISVYAELSHDRYEVFVRDSGPGFNTKRIPADRLGIRESIIGARRTSRRHRRRDVQAGGVDGGAHHRAATNRQREGRTMSEKVRVVVVDDHDVIRVGVKQSLGDGVEVVGEGRDVETAIDAITASKPDVVILDVHLPGGMGGGALDVLDACLKKPDPPRFLALSVSDAAEDVVAVVRAGARGYVTKSISGPELTDAVVRVAQDDAVFSPRLAGFVLDAFGASSGDIAVADEDLDKLTAREQEVMRLIARGYSYREVGEKLFISIKTVETHVSAVLRKLQLSSRHELAHWAAQRRIV